MKNSGIFVIFILVLLGTACADSRIFDDVVTIEEDIWPSANIIQFDAAVNDISLSYDILLHLRNTGSYDYSNLWLFIETKAPGGAVMRDTVEYILADEKGAWLGQGFSSVKSLMVPYKLNVKFPQRGIYTFAIQQGMRDENLEGIKNVGLRIQVRE